MLKISVLGTSNSILEYGWTYPFKKSSKLNLTKIACMGKSCGYIFPLFESSLNLSDCDVLIIDLAVNESVFLNWELNEEDIYNYYKYIVHNCFSNKVVPVLLILPRKDSNPNQSKILDLYKKISSEFNVPYFDAIQLLKGLDDSGLSRDDCFRDGGHMREWLAIAVGKELENTLLQLPLFRKVHKQYRYRKLKVYDVNTCLNDHIKVHRSNSLFSKELGTINSSSSDYFTFTIPDDECIVGFCLNLGQSYGLISIEGKELINLDLSNTYNKENQIFVLSTMYSPEKVSPYNGKIKIKTQSYDDIEMKSIYHLLHEETANTEVSQLELLCLISESIQEFDGLEILDEIFRINLTKEFSGCEFIIHAIDLYNARKNLF